MSDDNKSALVKVNEVSNWMLRYARSRLAAMMGSSHGGLRNVYEQFGWPQQVMPQQLFNMYLRNPLGSRIIRAYPEATWREYPTIRDEKGDSSQEKLSSGKDAGKANPNYSPFVAAVEDFMDASKAMLYLGRADRLASIGRYGILFMGFDDGQEASKPLPAGKHKLIFMSAYAETSCQITRYDNNRNSPRFGMPEFYTINTNSGMTGGGGLIQSLNMSVHHSRVIHIVEFPDENEIFGTPRLLPVYNPLSDLEKVLGGSAETFWLNARQGLALEADKDAELADDAVADMKEQAQEFQHQMGRILAMRGITAKVLNANVADPGPNAEKLLDIIAGGSDIPKRILIGSERGELSSSQDQENWAAKVDARQNNFASPVVLVPFLQKMIETGNIPTPEKAFWVEWPKSNALSETQQAEISAKKAQAIASYVSNAAAEQLVPPQEFRVDVLGMPPESEYDLPEEEPLDETDPNVIEQFGGGVEGDGTEEALPDDTLEVNAYGLRTFRRDHKPHTRKRLVLNATPRSLYVYRNLLNGDEVRKWFFDQGVGIMLEADDMHVTIAYSRAKLDWLKIGDDWTGDSDSTLKVREGGPRVMELFGTGKNTLVMAFSSSSLSWRHEDIKRAGASWDWPEYNPHITLTTKADEAGVTREVFDSIKPFTGELRFGPELFEELVEDWSSTVKEKARG